MSDTNLLLSISAAYFIIANTKNIREKNLSYKWIEDYFKTRNFNIINDLQLDEDFLFGNYAKVPNKFIFVIKNDRARNCKTEKFCRLMCFYKL
jgi:hypothetical protein